VTKYEPKRRANKAAQIVTSTDPLLIPGRRSISATRRLSFRNYAVGVYGGYHSALHVIHGLLPRDKRGRIHPQMQKQAETYTELSSQCGTGSHYFICLAINYLAVYGVVLISSCA
jgi:hypothetical protein